MARAEVTLPIARAAALDHVNGKATNPRVEPWDEDAWNAACARFDRPPGADPDVLADLWEAV